MSRKIHWWIQTVFTGFQFLGEPMADHFAWSNTFQVLYHGFLAYGQQQLGSYAQQFNIDGTKPPMANIQTTTQVTTDIQPRKENQPEESAQ